jgi:RNA polymerase sigma factor (sigma-70 family)
MATVVPHPRAELERLYSEHGAQVRAICGSILRNRHEAEDASQQVFVAALRALRGGAVPRDAGAWLATIARHESWARARRSSATALPEELEDRGQEDPAITVVRRAEIAETWQTIADLPASQREALLLREVRGLGYDELAGDLQVSRASVRSLLNRARATLRMQLERGAAVFTGAQWVNVLARVFDSASTSPALPAAGRAAAAGLGALAIAGGAVVASAPTHHAHRRPTVHGGAKSSAAPRIVAVSGQDHRPRSSVRIEDARHRSEHSGSQARDRDSSGEERSSTGPGPSSSLSGSDGGSGTSGTSGSGGGGETVTTSDSSSLTTSSTSGSDGGTSSGGSSGSGGTSDSGSSGDSGTSDSSTTPDPSGSSSGSSDSPDGGS